MIGRGMNYYILQEEAEGAELYPRRLVKIGTTDNAVMEIRDGLTPGERVVISGLAKL
jgi:hypothetical protein